jgi:hypothetical protein
MKPWQMWVRGFIAAAIAGLGTGLTGMAVGVTPLQLKALITANVAMTVGAYLQKSPLPNQQN